MGYGGPTWDDAGPFTAGTNTFNVADATQNGDFGLHDIGFWVLTLTGYATVTVQPGGPGVLYAGGPTYADRAYRTPDDFTIDGYPIFDLAPGSYHWVSGHFGSSGPTTYTVTVTITPKFQHHTAWLTTLQDRDDNQLTISGGLSTGQLQLDLNLPEWQDTKPFYVNVVNPYYGARTGEAAIAEAFGTDGGPAGHPQGSGSGDADADACAVAHAFNGDTLSQYWNADTYDGGIPDGPPVCRPLGEGEGSTPGPAIGASREYQRNVGALFVPDNIRFTDMIGAYGIRVLEALEGLKAVSGSEDYRRGVLPYPDAATDGVPSDAIASGTVALEWHPTDEFQLLSVEVTGDYAERDYDGSGDPTFYPSLDYFINDAISSEHSGDLWNKGQVGTPDSTSRSHGSFTFTLPASTVDWVTLDAIGSWDDGSPLDTNVFDAVIAQSLPDGAMPEFAVGTHFVYNDALVAARFTFRSPRYRWTWLEDGAPVTVVPPRRTVGRPGDLLNAARTVGAGATPQSGSRTLGGVL